MKTCPLNKKAKCDEGECAWWIYFGFREIGDCAMTSIAITQRDINDKLRELMKGPTPIMKQYQEYMARMEEKQDA
jgi:hypothetical protein